MSGQFFKVFGLRYNDPNGLPVARDDNYLSNFQFAKPGDILTDDDGNPLEFGSVGIAYANPPVPANMEVESTGFWYDLTTNTVWSRTKKTNGDIVDVDQGVTSSDMMLKSVYDSNDDGSVNNADQLYGGVGITVTAAEARTHINDATIHRIISDLVTSPVALWSSTKIQTKLDAQTHTAAQIVSGVLAWDRLPFTITSALQNDMLIWSTALSQFVNARMATGVGIDLVYGTTPDSVAINNTLTLDQARANGYELNGDIVFNYGTIGGIPDPVLADDVVNKAYADAVAADQYFATLLDVDIPYPEGGQFAMYDGEYWANFYVLSSGMADITIDLLSRTMTVSVPYDVTEVIDDYISGAELPTASAVVTYTSLQYVSLNNVDYLANTQYRHAMLHGIDSVTDHEGVYGAMDGNLVVFDSNGLPDESGISATALLNAVNGNTVLSHNQLHYIDSTDDHAGVYNAVEGNVIVFDSEGLPADSSVAVNDSGASTYDLWSASRIVAELISWANAIGDLGWLDTVGTDEIDDLAVTSAKMSITGVGAGAYSRANITVDAAGRITYISSGALAPGETPWESGDGYSIFYTGGFVGINVVDPQDTLHVNGRILLDDSTWPIDTTNRIHAYDGELFWDGTQISVQHWSLDSLGLWHYGNTNIDGNLFITGQAYHSFEQLTDEANITVDCDRGNMFEVTIAGNRTFDNPTNLEDTTYIIYVTQGSGGSHIPAFGSAYKFASGITPEFSTGEGTLDILVAICRRGVLSCTVQKDMG